MWSFRSEARTPSTLRYVAACATQPATFADVLRGWCSDAAFRASFNALLAEAPFSAFRWETPALTAATATQPFEFVLLNDPGLARQPDPEAFAEHFPTALESEMVVAFANLSGDARLVVPCPMADPLADGHLAAFVRGAPDAQRDVLWYTVGGVLSRRLSAKPVWLSTAGAGVSWPLLSG